MSNLEAALQYAGRSWHVFAISNKKIPFAGTHGFKDGTTDPAILASMWQAHPYAAIGLATGSHGHIGQDGRERPVGPNLVVLDADGTFGQIKFKELQLPKTLTSRTPTGGYHFFYLSPTPLASHTLHKGPNPHESLELKADKALVLLPPSAGRTWLLDILPHCLTPDEAKRISKPARVNAPRSSPENPLQLGPPPPWITADKLASAPCDLENIIFNNELPEILHALKQLPASCSYDEWFRVGASLHTFAPDANGLAIFVAWSRTSAKHLEMEGEQAIEAACARKWDEYARWTGERRTLASIYAAVRDKGRIGNGAGTNQEPWRGGQNTDTSGQLPPWQTASINGAVHQAWQKPSPAQPIVLAQAKGLDGMTFPIIKFVVPGFVVEGLTLLAGKPKIGKSWLLLQASIAVASGGQTLGATCERGDVLYCALEDNMRRMQTRMRKLTPSPWPEQLYFLTEMPRLGAGGAERIREWCHTVEHPRLIIIDTLAMVRPPNKAKEQSSYDADYTAILSLRELAHELGLAIVLVHHLRKAESDDAFDTVSGTLGLTAVPDTTIVVQRGKGSDAILHVRGRDLEHLEKSIRFNNETCQWQMLGDAADARRGFAFNAVMEAMEEFGDDPVSPLEIARISGMKHATVRGTMRRMAGDQIVGVGKGRYKRKR